MKVDINSLPEHRKRESYCGGYLYVIAFSSGLVKVGRTENPKARIASHEAGAAQHCAEIVNLWLSQRHDNFEKNETRLIRLLGSADQGNEYFRVPFEDAVNAAESLHFDVMSEEQRRTLRKESAARIDAFAKSITGYRPDKVGIQVPAEFPIGWILQLLFSENLPPVVSIGSGETLADSIDLIVEKTGIDRNEVLAWSYLDVVEHIAKTAIRCAVLDMQLKAIRDRRDDLTESHYWTRSLNEDVDA